MVDFSYPRQSYSERHGHKEVVPPLDPGHLSNQLRLEFIDALRNTYQDGLWDEKCCRKGAVDWQRLFGNLSVRVFGQERMYQAMCLDVCINVFRGGEFYEVFDVIEAIANEIGEGRSDFFREVNGALTRNKAPYILHKSVSKEWVIVQTGSEKEREAVLHSLADLKEPAFIKTREHFEKAGCWLTRGDCAESAGQSAKALEACLRTLTGMPDATGGQALEAYAQRTGLSPRFKEFMGAVWQYRNKTQDVGHAKKDNDSFPPPDKWEAQALYIFVAGSLSFLINRLRERKNEA